MSQNPYQGGDALAYLDSILPETPENLLIECQELFRIDLTQAMRNLRKAVGLTQKEIAEKLGVTQSWVSKLESANNDHTFESILAYLDALGADFEALIYLEGRKFIGVPAQLQMSREEIHAISSPQGEQPETLNSSEFNLIPIAQKPKFQEAQKIASHQGLWGTAA